MPTNGKRLRWAVPVPLAVAVLVAAGCAGGSTGRTESSTRNTAAEPGGAAAIVGGEAISFEEMDERAREASIKPYQALYQARRAVLEQMIQDRLLEAEAASRGVTKDQLVEEEINQKVAPVAEDDVKSFFDQNRARMGGRSLEQIQGQIRTFLTRQNVQNARSEFLDSLREKSGVQILLEPPRVNVRIAANDPSRGPEGAPVTIVEYSDFQ